MLSKFQTHNNKWCSKDDTTTRTATDCIQPTGVSTTSMVLDSTASTITIKFTMPANADSVMVLAAPISVGFLTIRDSVFYAVGSTIASSSATPATVYYRVWMILLPLRFNSKYSVQIIRSYY
ncbi:MAG: hypothetical protein R2807_10000 [Chitinophagales bacterium]